MYQAVGTPGSRLTRVTWMLEELGQPYEIVKTKQHTDVMRRHNPSGKGPALVDGDLVLSQSGAIQCHVAEVTGRFRGHSAAERHEVLRWMMWDNHKLSGQAGMLRFLMNFLPGARRPAEVIAFQSGRLRAALATLEAHLAGGGRDWIVGASPSLADTACCGYLYYPEPFGFDRPAYPGIDRWLARLSALPGWKHPYDLMPGSPADRI